MSLPAPVKAWESRLASGAAGTEVVAFAAARSALVALFEAMRLERGSAVALPPLTCKVLPLAVLAAGMRPVYCDIDPATLNLDPAELRRLNARTPLRAVIFQRTYGGWGGLDEIAAFAREAGLILLEDCAQCLPAPFGGPPLAGLAAIASHNAGKPLPAAAGGVAITRDRALAAALRDAQAALPGGSAPAAIVRGAASWVRNRLLTPGLYWRAFDLHRKIAPAYRARSLAEELAAEVAPLQRQPAAVDAGRGVAWMDRLPALAEHRRRCAAAYLEALSGQPGLTLPLREPAALYWFPVLVDRKPALLERARAGRIEVIPWPISVPIYPHTDPAAQAAYGYAAGSCPAAESVAARLVGLPTHFLVNEASIAGAVRLLRSHGAGTE